MRDGRLAERREKAELGTGFGSWLSSVRGIIALSEHVTPHGRKHGETDCGPQTRELPLPSVGGWGQEGRRGPGRAQQSTGV